MLCSRHRSAIDSLRWMTCRHGFVRWKSRAARSQRKTCNNDERRRAVPTTAFRRFANPADRIPPVENLAPVVSSTAGVLYLIRDSLSGYERIQALLEFNGRPVYARGCRSLEAASSAGTSAPRANSFRLGEIDVSRAPAKVVRSAVRSGIAAGLGG